MREGGRGLAAPFEFDRDIGLVPGVTGRRNAAVMKFAGRNWGARWSLSIILGLGSTLGYVCILEPGQGQSSF
jgi:hypothetical protein